MIREWNEESLDHRNTLLYAMGISEEDAQRPIIGLINSWNEFLFAVLFASVHAKTAPLGAMGFVTIRDVAWSNMAAAGIIITLPVLVFTLLVQKNLVQGLTAGAVKG